MKLLQLSLLVALAAMGLAVGGQLHTAHGDEASGDSKAVEHPVDPLLKMTRDALHRLQHEVSDYQCVLRKQERVSDVLQDEQATLMKVRLRRERDGKVLTPAGVYLWFLAPASYKRLEVLWREGKNENKLATHFALRGCTTPPMHLDPKGKLAMKSQRYPLNEVGIEHAVLRLIASAERLREREDLDLQTESIKINKRPCRSLTIKCKRRTPGGLATLRAAFDEELQLPIWLAEHAWPDSMTEQPVLVEQYFFLNLRTNLGLGDIDFDESNPAYHFD
jgi:hypothetical protein